MIDIRNRISKVMRGSAASRILLINSGTNQDSNFLYMTGFTSGVFEGSALIIEKGYETLLTSKLEEGIALEQKPKHMDVIAVKSREEMRSRLSSLLKGKTVGINGNYLPYSTYISIKRIAKPRNIIDTSKSFNIARSVKEPYELQLMKKANHIIKKVLSEMPKFFKVGITEKQLAAHVEYLIREYNGDGSSFPPIVAFGKNAALPHHMPDGTKLTENSIVLLDCGAKFENYSSDVTRTYVFRPDKKSEKYKRIMEIYGIVENAQRIALDSIRSGVQGSVPHAKAEEYIDSAYDGRYEGKFIHSLGHPIGIDVHDVGTSLSINEERELKPGMVVSDEPGIYVRGFGGVRIEDDVIVTANEAKMM